MTNDSKLIESRHILSGWKEIANYLGRGVRTAQRYEARLQLPVRRPSCYERGSVMAITAEVDAWINTRPLRGPLKPSQP